MSRWNPRQQGPSPVTSGEDAELNLIPLIDIMSVLVAFLLIYSTDVEVVQNTKGVEIPQSTAEAQPNQSVVVMITKEQLFVQGELVADIAEIARAADGATSSRCARCSSGRCSASTRRRVAAGGTRQSREITVMADKSLPYDVVKKVMATCTAAAYGRSRWRCWRRTGPPASTASTAT